MKIFLMFLAVALVTGCAQPSAIRPSSGHIDDLNNGQAANRATDIPKPVKNNAYLPPPKPRAKVQTYSVVVNEVPVKEILFALARESQTNIDIHPGIQGRVTLNAVDQTLPAILERLAKQVDLTYKMENNVLSIAPDSPILRTYQINYVNMQRTTKGGISVANEIASANISTTSGSTGTNSNNSSMGGTNTSSTSVESESKNYFWDSLIQNIKDILAESDKEVLVNRLGTDARLQAQYDAQSRGTGDASIRSPKEGGSSKSAGNKFNPASGGDVSGSGDQNAQGGVNEASEKISENIKPCLQLPSLPTRKPGC